jgi:hypothetical protein
MSKASNDWAHGLRIFQASLRSVAQAVVVGLAGIAVLATVAAAFGFLPWPQVGLFFGSQAVPQAGMWLQIGLTVVLVLLTFSLPANARMTRLERSHRSFAIGMEDVARAYRQSHAADRAGVFALSGEFDSMRARMEQLRSHPDLRQLEPELLQLAAQMSLTSRELARIYSDDKVARAKEFLKHRQQDAQDLTDRLAIARRTCEELRRWLGDIEAEERVAQTQIRRLEADLKEILPTLGYDFDLEDLRDANIVALPNSANRA